jgi:nicotinamidase-related amidase
MEDLDPSRTALLVMDVQRGLVSRFEAEPVLPPLSAAIAAARAAGALVVYVRIGFRRGAPEISRRNRGFAGAVGGGFGLEDDSTQVHEAVAPLPGEPVVVKKRVSAFTGSDLDVLLRSRDIATLVLTGILTSGVVLSTLREAADRDYELVVLSDCCFDDDPDVQRVLLEKVFARQAEVLASDKLPGLLGR